MRDHLAIGRTIARLRTEHGLSQEELALELQLTGLDVSRDMIMNIERGRVGLTITFLAQIAVVLGEPVIEFCPTAPRRGRGGKSWLDRRVTVVVHGARGRRSGQEKR